MCLICLLLPLISTPAISLHLPEPPISVCVQSFFASLPAPLFSLSLSLSHPVPHNLCFCHRWPSCRSLLLFPPSHFHFFPFPTVNQPSIADSPCCVSAFEESEKEELSLVSERFLFSVKTGPSRQRHFILFQRLKRHNHKQHKKAAQPDTCRQCCKGEKRCSRLKLFDISAWLPISVVDDTFKWEFISGLGPLFLQTAILTDSCAGFGLHHIILKNLLFFFGKLTMLPSFFSLGPSMSPIKVNFSVRYTAGTCFNKFYIMLCCLKACTLRIGNNCLYLINILAPRASRHGPLTLYMLFALCTKSPLRRYSHQVHSSRSQHL